MSNRVRQTTLAALNRIPSLLKNQCLRGLALPDIRWNPRLPRNWRVVAGAILAESAYENRMIVARTSRHLEGSASPFASYIKFALAIPSLAEPDHRRGRRKLARADAAFTGLPLWTSARLIVDHDDSPSIPLPDQHPRSTQ